MHAEIVGDDMQAVVIDLQPGEALRAEAGVLTAMTQSIRMETVANTGGQSGLMGGLMSGLKRVLSGDSFFVTTFTADHQPGQAIFSAPYPGKIIDLNLAEMGTILCQRDSYLCSDPAIDITVAFTRKLGAGLFGGEGFILQKLVGQGRAFIHAGGMVMPFDLAPGETLRVDTGCLVAMQETVDYDIQMVRGLKSMIFGGEGLFFASLTGPGRVWVQTLPLSRLAGRLMAAVQPSGNAEQATGLAGIGGNLLGGLVSGD